MDAIRFNYPDKVLQLVLLWFSAEMTGNDGEQFLAVAKKVAPEENVERLQKKLSELLPSKSTSPLNHPPPINPLPEADQASPDTATLDH
jgi:hypothetical protein